MPRDIWEEALRPLTSQEASCPDCHGQGRVEVILGTRYCAGQGGPYEPIMDEEPCGRCLGTGQRICLTHGLVAVACWVREVQEILCDACLQELETSLELVRMEVIQRAAQDLSIQDGWGKEPT